MLLYQRLDDPDGTGRVLSKKILLLISMFVVALYQIPALAAISVLCAENFYGDVAKALGGSNVKVTSIIHQASGDPHLFSLPPSILVTAASADLVIFNGAGYDPWIKTLLTNTGERHPLVIDAASLMNMTAGSNPHIWFKPETMPVVASHITDALKSLDPAHDLEYRQRLNQFKTTYKNVISKINDMKSRYHGISVTATEPVFNYMIDALGLKMKETAFQYSVMNDIPPSVSQIRDFEDTLRKHKVHVLIYNDQVINPMTEKMRKIAEEEHIPVVGISEIMPAHTTYTAWIIDQLTKLDNALRSSRKKT